MTEKDLIEKREQMSKESWIRNVMRIYPEKTRLETEELYSKLWAVDENKKIDSLNNTTNEDAIGM